MGLGRKQGPGFPAPRGPAACPSHTHVTACVTHERLTVQNAWAAGGDGRAHPGCRVRGGEGPGSPRSRSRLSAAAATGLCGPRGRSARRGGSSRASCDSPSWDPPLHSGDDSPALPRSRPAELQLGTQSRCTNWRGQNDRHEEDAGSPALTPAQHTNAMLGLHWLNGPP